jgi:hypothetical protein
MVMSITENEISSIIKERVDNFELNPDERFYRPVIADTAMAIQSARDDHRPEFFYKDSNIEFDTFVSDMNEYGQAVMQVEQCNERGIVITTQTGCFFNPMHSVIFDRYAEAGIQVISHNEYLKQYIQNLDLRLSYNEDFEWGLQERLERFKSPKKQTEVDKQKIQQAIAKRARKLRKKELHNESIKKYSRI